MADIKRYTLADVAKNKGKDKSPVWMVYKDSVYDITTYMDEHPAGAEVILDEAGTDATKAFDDAGHTPDAYNQLAPYKIGELVEEEKRYDANGKKKKRVVDVPPSDKPQGRSCINVITCGLLC